MKRSQSQELELLRDTEVAELLKVSRRTVWRLSAAGNIPSPIRLGGSVRWRLKELDEHLGGLK